VAEKPKDAAPAEEEAKDAAVSEAGAEGEAEGKKKKFKLPSKKLMIMVGGPLLLLLLAGGGAYMMGFIGAGDEKAAGGGKEAEKKPEKTVFYDLPELLVNLNSAGRRTNFLKITVSLEVASESDIPKLEAVKPRIVDSFQVYLRELRLDDLRGSAGVYRLREELLARVTASAQTAQVKDVLFKEMLVQ
jgi:flagellar FliL protein